jgi:IS5 family transposase
MRIRVDPDKCQGSSSSGSTRFSSSALHTHAHQFKRARRALKFLRIRLGRVIRDIRRKIAGNEGLNERFATLLALAHRVRFQDHRQRGDKVYALHAPEVECIGKGSVSQP